MGVGNLLVGVDMFPGVFGLILVGVGGGWSVAVALQS